MQIEVQYGNTGEVPNEKKNVWATERKVNPKTEEFEHEQLEEESATE